MRETKRIADQIIHFTYGAHRLRREFRTEWRMKMPSVASNFIEAKTSNPEGAFGIPRHLDYARDKLYRVASSISSELNKYNRPNCFNRRFHRRIVVKSAHGKWNSMPYVPARPSLVLSVEVATP